MPHPRDLLLLVWTAGCGPDPRQLEAQRYAEAMGRAASDNAALARSTLELAEKLRKQSIDADAAAGALETDMLPRARALASRARGVMPTTAGLQPGHQQIVEAWSERADAYADLARAWRAGDVPAFAAAEKANRAASDEAAEGVLAVNAELSRYGLTIDPWR